MPAIAVVVILVAVVVAMAVITIATLATLNTLDLSFLLPQIAIYPPRSAPYVFDLDLDSAPGLYRQR